MFYYLVHFFMNLFFAFISIIYLFRKFCPFFYLFRQSEHTWGKGRGRFCSLSLFQLSNIPHCLLHCQLCQKITCHEYNNQTSCDLNFFKLLWAGQEVTFSLCAYVHAWIRACVRCTFSYSLPCEPIDPWSLETTWKLIY